MKVQGICCLGYTAAREEEQSEETQCHRFSSLTKTASSLQRLLHEYSAVSCHKQQIAVISHCF